MDITCIYQHSCITIPDALFAAAVLLDFLQSRTRQAATCFNQEMRISSCHVGYYRIHDKLKDKLRR
ncbi:hypothetical protein QQ045_026822 [Rhodiola kirilowii]